MSVLPVGFSPFMDFSEMQQQEIASGAKARFIHGEHMTFAQWEFAEGALLKVHAHLHEQISMVLEGRFQLTVGGKTQIMEPGMIAVIPGNIEHSGVALTAVRAIDIFSPVREDYLKFGAPAQ